MLSSTGLKVWDPWTRRFSPSGWLTTSPQIAKNIRALMSSGKVLGVKHIHDSPAGRIAARVYPISLCLGILRGLRTQLSEDRAMSVDSGCELSSAEAEVSTPCAATGPRFGAMKSAK